MSRAPHLGRPCRRRYAHLEPASPPAARQEGLKMPFRPDVLVLPSDLASFAKARPGAAPVARS